MVAELTDLKYRRRVAWAFAGASLLAVLLFAVLSWQVASRLQELRQYRQLQAGLKASDFQSSALAAETLLQLNYWYQRFAENPAKFTALERAATVREILGMVALLNQGNYDSAVLKFNSLLDGELQDLLLALGRGEAKLDLIGNLKTEFQTYGIKLKELEQQRQQIPEQISQNVQLLQQQRLLAREVSANFAALFGLAPEWDENGSGPQLPVYQQGVLADLPRVVGIPEALPDLTALKNILQNLNTKVNLRGSNVAERFKNELEGTRSQMQDLSASLQALAVENAALEQQLQILSGEVFGLSQDLQTQLSVLVLEILKPGDQGLFLGLAQWLSRWMR